MKYTRGQFTNEYYQIWEMGLLLPTPRNSSVYSVKYRKNEFDEYSRVTLYAAGVSDALERACYSITYASPWRPEDIDLHAVYDSEDNLLWVDEPYYHLVQKKYEFRGMERREFLVRFGATSAAILFGLQPQNGRAATVGVSLGGTATGFGGEQIYSTPGSYSWVVPAGVTSVCVVCVGGGGGGGGGASAGGGGGGGACGWKNAAAVTPGSTISIAVGDGGNGSATNEYNGTYGSTGGASSFGALITANGGGGGSGYYGNISGVTGGAGGTCTGGTANYSGGKGGGINGAGVPTSRGGGDAGNNSAGNEGSEYWDSTAYPTVAAGGVLGGAGGGTGNGYCGGGGVGIFTSTSGTHGRVAIPGTYGTGVLAGQYGGGGASSYNGYKGGSGAVRIIWGAGRSFPDNAT